MQVVRTREEGRGTGRRGDSGRGEAGLFGEAGRFAEGLQSMEMTRGGHGSPRGRSLGRKVEGVVDAVEGRMEKEDVGDGQFMYGCRRRPRVVGWSTLARMN